MLLKENLAIAGALGAAAAFLAYLNFRRIEEKLPPLVSFTRNDVAEFWLQGLNWKAVFLGAKEAEKAGHRVFRLRGSRLFQKPTVYCADPAFFNVLLGPNGLDKSNESYDALRDATGLGYNNLITRKWHELYMDIRKVIMPFFSSANMTKRLTCCHEKLEHFMKVFEVAAEENRVIEVTEECCKLTLDCLGLAAFGYDFKALSGGGSEGLQVMETVPFLMEEVANKQRFIPFRRYMTFLKDVRKSRNILKENMKLCKSILANREAQDKRQEKGNLLVDWFLQAPYESDEHRAADVMLFLVGGYETAGHQIAWCLYCMVTNPECMKKAQEEVEQVMGDAKIPSVEQTKSMKYLYACIRETLRLFPATPEGSGRITSEKMHLGQYIVPAGTQVIVPHYTMLHSQGWVDPESFRPERWFDTSPEAENVKKHHFITFGYGARICPGMNFALLELRLSIATVLRNFDLTPKQLPPEGNEMLYYVTAKPRGGVWLLPKRR